MHSLLTRVVLVTVTVLGMTALTNGPANAGTKCERIDPLSGACIVSVHTPGSPNRPGAADPRRTGSSAACYWDPTKQGLTRPPTGPVPCTSSLYGYWSNTYNCYVQVDKPQPPAGDPNWQGHKPGDGAVYSCYQPQTDMSIYFWSGAPPPGAGTGPTARDVAQIAVKKLNLTAIQIGIAPKPGPNSVGLVGMPVWMWAATPNAHNVGPISATASAGGITITATAKVLGISWEMGDGTTVICHSAGTPYQASYGQKASPDCGHTYTKSSWRQPGGRYTVTATSDWAITWSGAGQSGTIRLGGLTRSAQITIGEAQVLVN